MNVVDDSWDSSEVLAWRRPEEDDEAILQSFKMCKRNGWDNNVEENEEGNGEDEDEEEEEKAKGT